MKRTPIIKIRPIRGVFDSDWDGVPNFRDCVWYDSRRQDWKPSPSFFSSTSDIPWTRDMLNSLRVDSAWGTPFGIFQKTGQKELTLIRRISFGNEEDINRVKKSIKAMGWKFVDDA